MFSRSSVISQPPDGPHRKAWVMGVRPGSVTVSASGSQDLNRVAKVGRAV